MLPDKKTYSISEVLQIFELSWNDIPDIRKQYPSVQIAQKVMDEFKIILKKQYRKIAFKYHPDHGGNEDDFKVIQRVYETVLKSCKVIPLQRRRPTMVVRRYYYYDASGGTTGAGDNSTTGGY